MQVFDHGECVDCDLPEKMEWEKMGSEKLELHLLALSPTVHLLALTPTVGLCRESLEDGVAQQGVCQALEVLVLGQPAKV